MPDTKVNHPIFARWYAWMSPKMEQAGYRDRRGQLLAGLTGEVIEVGAGNGMNFAHYPPEVTRVLAVIWPTLGGGCHAHRDTRAAIEAAGFTIDHLEDLRLPDGRFPAPTSPHILGTATRPADPAIATEG